MSEVIETPTLPSLAPRISTDTQAFWDATKEGRLLITRCHACGEAIWYPRPICPFCHSTDTGWEEVSGHGHVYTYTVVYRGPGPWGAAAPYVVAYVELDEGPRMMTNIVDCDPEVVAIGTPVTVIFHQSEGEGALPRFRIAE